MNDAAIKTEVNIVMTNETLAKIILSFTVIFITFFTLKKIYS